MKRLLLLTLFLLTLLIPQTLADPEQYTNPGVTRDSTYVQDGTGVWTDRTATEYLRTYTSIQSYFPMVGDVDNDNVNEIIILADDNLIILNMTFGTGMVTEQTLTHGTTTIDTQKFSITPALFDYDSDQILEIISCNTTHMILYEWNGTQIVENQSATTGLNVTSTAAPVFQTPVIKCAQGAQFSSGNDTCVMTIANRDGAVADPTFLIYDINDNTVYKVQAAAATVADATLRNTHLADGDNDGYLEAYASQRSGSAGDLRVYKVEVSATPTVTQLYWHNLPNGALFTDIIVSNIYRDGGILEITWGYSSDTVNYDAITINANTGAVLDSGYCAATCPEGDMIGANVFEASDTTYSSFVGDICYYVRNYAQSNLLTGQTPNEDTVFCVSQYGGAGFVNNFVSNTQNFSNNPMIHQADLHGSTGLLLPRFTIQSGTKHAVPALPDYPVLIPVDVEKSGSLDIIAMNGTVIAYQEDAYTNSNYDITNLDFDTGNTVCQNQLVGFDLTINDNEEDQGVCFYTEKYANGTIITNSTNSTVQTSEFSSNDAQEIMTYHADQTGTFILDFQCGDQYHPGVFDTESYTMVIAATDCNDKGEEPGSQGQPSSAEAAAEAEFDDDVDELFDGLGVESIKARNIITIIAVFMIAVLVFIKSSSILLAVVSIPATLLIAFFLGLVGVFPLIVLCLFCVAVLTYLFMTGRGDT